MHANGTLAIMSSFGFNFAHVNAQQERITEKIKQRDEKNVQDHEKRNIGIKYGGNKKVHPGDSLSMGVAGNFRNN
ncbi:hypothetical protein QVD17_19034 [Tagetes erecta]|uniref:Uncharacterized protein n=1 Tax=Tagetes erecta TaxID=13708 RepID=A0AAD8KLU5_TARER|nr:hypothetical protein QVD17_19034 [Tagetes erecta]